MWKRCAQQVNKDFASDIVKSKWPSRIESTLRAAGDIVQDLKKANILITCPTGSEFSCVLSSLV